MWSTMHHTCCLRTYKASAANLITLSSSWFALMSRPKNSLLMSSSRCTFWDSKSSSRSSHSLWRTYLTVRAMGFLKSHTSQTTSSSDRGTSEVRQEQQQATSCCQNSNQSVSVRRFSTWTKKRKSAQTARPLFTQTVWDSSLTWSASPVKRKYPVNSSTLTSVSRLRRRKKSSPVSTRERKLKKQQFWSREKSRLNNNRLVKSPQKFHTRVWRMIVT